MSRQLEESGTAGYRPAGTKLETLGFEHKSKFLFKTWVGSIRCEEAERFAKKVRAAIPPQTCLKRVENDCSV